MYQRRSSPIRVGEEIDVNIEAVGEKGDGIAKKDGFVIFVPNTKVGDRVKIKVTRVLSKVGFAEVVGKGTKSDSEKEEDDEESEEEEDYGDDEEETEEETKKEADEETEEGEEQEDSYDFGSDTEK